MRGILVLSVRGHDALQAHADAALVFELDGERIAVGHCNYTCVNSCSKRWRDTKQSNAAASNRIRATSLPVLHEAEPRSDSGRVELTRSNMPLIEDFVQASPG